MLGARSRDEEIWFAIRSSSGKLLNMGHLRLWLGMGLSLLVMLATLGVVATVRNHSDTSELIQTLEVMITITATASAW